MKNEDKTQASQSAPLLFQPVSIRDLELKNRLVVAPMCQYSARDGLVNDWHFAHLAKFAIGGFGALFTEACAVEANGRITHGDLGIWSDAHAKALEPIVKFVKSQGCAPGVQLAHAGRKASMQRPWHGNGPLDENDRARGEVAWPVMAASPEPVDDGWLVPAEMTLSDIQSIVAAFAEATKRADETGFEIAEIHGAHGYLLHTFLSPLSNHRSDAYGGDLNGRMKMALEVARAVRAQWPDAKPLFFRVSSVDGADNGWTLEDSTVLAKALKTIGIDVIDCSSGGNSPKGATAAGVPRTPGFQVPFAAEIRAEAEIMTQAVGLILDGPQAEEILQNGSADLIAIGREALYDPFWPIHQAANMGCDPDMAQWPDQYGWWLKRRMIG